MTTYGTTIFDADHMGIRATVIRDADDVVDAFVRAEAIAKETPRAAIFTVEISKGRRGGHAVWEVLTEHEVKP